MKNFNLIGYIISTFLLSIYVYTSSEKIIENRLEVKKMRIDINNILLENKKYKKILNAHTKEIIKLDNMAIIQEPHPVIMIE